MKKMILLASLSAVFIYWVACRFSPAAAAVAAEDPIYVIVHVDVMPNFTDAGRD